MNGLKFRQPQKQSKTTDEESQNQEPLEHKPLRLLFDKQDELEEKRAPTESVEQNEISRTKGKAQRTKVSGSRRGQAPPGQGHRRIGGGGEDEFDRVVAMLENIRRTLEKLMVVTPRVIPDELHPTLGQSWSLADEGFKMAIAALQNRTQRVKLKPRLATAGFTGEMLGMKETSLNYHMARVDKAVLTYNNRPTLVEKFVKWVKPGFKVMNSVLGSLSTIPGVEVGKEFKEHLESAYEVVETGHIE